MRFFRRIRSHFSKTEEKCPGIGIQVPFVEEPDETESITYPSEPQFVQTKTLFISAGHSYKDPGAVGNGYSEADIVLEFRDLLAMALRANGVAFKKDGEVSVNLPLSDAIKAAAEHDIAIEFHCNAFSSPSATGVETLSKGAHYYISDEINRIISTTLGINNRGSKGEASGQHSRLGFISRGNGIIVELFFISNPKDLQKYQQHKEKLALELAEYLSGLVYEEERIDGLG